MRKSFSPDFMAKVSLAAIKEDMTFSLFKRRVYYQRLLDNDFLSFSCNK